MHMSDLVFYITSIASAIGPITLAAASAAALYIIGPHGVLRSAERALNSADPELDSSDELKAQESVAQLVD
jgi:hypothetical protein